MKIIIATYASICIFLSLYIYTLSNFLPRSGSESCNTTSAIAKIVCHPLFQNARIKLFMNSVSIFYVQNQLMKNMHFYYYF